MAMENSKQIYKANQLEFGVGENSENEDETISEEIKTKFSRNDEM